MRKLILFLFVLILTISSVYADRTACLTNSDNIISGMLNDTGMVTTQDCTSDFGNYNIVVDLGVHTSGIRAASVPTIVLSSTFGGSFGEWDFTDDNCDVEFSQTSFLTGANPGTIDDGVATDPTIYSSGGDIGWCSNTGSQSTGITDNVAFDGVGGGGTANVFYWDLSDNDATGGDDYTQKGVYSGLVDSSLWNDEAKRIFNNSISYVCPYCFDECIPPATGNWEINKTCNIKNKDYNVTGNVSIFDNGFLNLTVVLS